MSPISRACGLHWFKALKRKVGAGVSLNPSTVYRVLNRQGLMRPGRDKVEDRRKYEAELPNEIWQSDVMHGPKAGVGDKQRKAYLIAFNLKSNTWLRAEATGPITRSR